MAWKLRHSTAGSGNVNIVKMGPFQDKDTPATEITTLAGEGTEVSKNGAAFGAGANLGSHDAEGYYPVVLTATITNTLGNLLIKSHNSAVHLPVWLECEVLSKVQYDKEVLGKAWEDWYIGTAVQISANVIRLAADVPKQFTDQWVWGVQLLDDGGGAAYPFGDRQMRRITAFNHTNGDATVEPAFPGSPAGTPLYELIPLFPAPDVSVPKTEVWKVRGSTDAAVRLKDLLEEAIPFTVGATPTPTTTAFGTNLTETEPNQFKDRSVLFTSGDLNGQSKKVASYTVTNGVIGCDALSKAPSSGDTGYIV